MEPEIRLYARPDDEAVREITRALSGRVFIQFMLANLCEPFAYFKGNKLFGKDEILKFFAEPDFHKNLEHSIR